ncbi:MAG: hypothetical protein KKD05_06660 [Candidatus Omnitrophica bacterium]|nr:hypothetical protein [Candidatus Omnitrophota bacterium]
MENTKNLQDNEFYQKAISLYRKKNYEYAIELLTQVLQENPEHQDCQRYLWDCIRQRNALLKHSFLATIFTKLKILILTLKFFMLNIIRPDEQTLELIKNIILLDPNNISALFKLSAVHSQRNQKTLAIAALEEILSIDKNNLLALKILADTYYTQKTYVKAKLMAIKILELSPRYLPAENILNDISALGTIEKGFDEIKPAT